MISNDDIDAGFYDCPVETRSGVQATLRLTAVPGRKSLPLLAEWFQQRDDFVVVLASIALPLPENMLAKREIKDIETFLDQLNVESLTALKEAAIPLNFGEALQKKMMAARRMLQTTIHHPPSIIQPLTPTSSAASNSPSPAPDSTPANSATGASPN